MEIKINEVNHKSLKCYVIFSTEFGNSKALWNGETPPEVNKGYFVEFEVPGILRWGEDIIISDKKEYVIKMDNGITQLAGMVESVDEDGYTVVRIDENIITLETEGSPFPIETFVIVKTDNLILFDVNY